MPTFFQKTDKMTLQFPLSPPPTFLLLGRGTFPPLSILTRSLRDSLGSFPLLPLLLHYILPSHFLSFPFSLLPPS